MRSDPEALDTAYDLQSPQTTTLVSKEASSYGGAQNYQLPVVSL